MEAWSEAAGAELAFIAPSRPVENTFIESFNRRLRDEFFNIEIFLDLADLACKLKHWRSDYNHCRPDSALADQTPEEFARRQAHAAQGSPDGGPCGPSLSHRELAVESLIQPTRLFPLQPFSRGAIMSQVRPSKALFSMPRTA
jgi:hypothetical protein